MKHDLKIGLLGLGAYAPSRVMENAEWATRLDTTDEWIRTRTGIERRRVAAEDESTADLACKAARVALLDAGISAADLDEIIVATDTPEVYTPDTASFVQHGLGAGPIPTYDLGGSGCAGFLQAVDVARSRVLSGKRRVLVVGAELLTRLMDWEDRSTAVLFGDGAGAMVIGDVGDRGGEILGAIAGTDGSKWDILCLRVGGTRFPFTLDRAQRGEHREVTMHGREVFRAAVGHMSSASAQLLEQLGLTLEDIDLIVPHQANKRIIDAVTKALHADPARVYVNVQDYGNTGSASVPLALAQARDEGRVPPGSRVLLTSFGAGFHWASLVIQF
jgi:3-oxoacyl-[acyl-carrier-protein] synthase-3